MDQGLKEIYQDRVVPKMMNQFGFDNPFMVPKVVKVVVNVGLGEATQNQAVVERVLSYLALITGQRGIPTLARKSISGFKLRKGEAIGVKVTLRRKRMYAFLERLLRTTLPRTRDFKGLSVEAFDAAGNYTIGLPEQLVFPELNFDQIDRPRGLEISLVTDTSDSKLARVLLEELGFPFKKDG